MKCGRSAAVDERGGGKCDDGRGRRRNVDVVDVLRAEEDENWALVGAWGELRE